MNNTNKRKAKDKYISQCGYVNLSELEPQKEDYKMISKSEILEGCDCQMCLEALEYYKLRLPDYSEESKPLEVKENTMNTLNVVASAAQTPTQSLEQETRNYLRSRLSKSYFDKCDELRPAFGLNDDPAPLTPKEVIERITSGMYLLPPEDDYNDADLTWYRPWDAIRWRDPAKKKDRIGFSLATKTLQKDRDATLDAIMTLDSKAALEALQKFESTTIH